MILLIDNYDSFVHNLARYFQLLGQETKVLRNDQITAQEITKMQPQAIIISPGPCTPVESGNSPEIIQAALAEKTPLLGVCLGHQTLATVLGGTVVRARAPRHGRTSEIQHNRTGIFANLASPLTVCRYHSLIVQENDLPKKLTVTATTADGTIMALAHQTRPAYGIQFHPESILTSNGLQILANFLTLTGITKDSTTLDSLVRHPQQVQTKKSPLHSPLHNHPITF